MSAMEPDKLDGHGKVAVCFIGDGAANQGVLMEMLNVSMLWELPVVFVCENNTFSEFTHSWEVTSGRIAGWASALGVPTRAVDGNDAVEVWQAAGEAVDRARGGGGPSFIEARTYRIHGHIEAEGMILGGGRYRDCADIDSWRAAGPSENLKSRLISSGTADAAALEALNTRVLEQVEEAAEYAEGGQLADPRLAETLIFA